MAFTSGRAITLMLLVLFCAYVKAQCQDTPSFDQFLDRFPILQAPLKLKDASFSSRRAGKPLSAAMTKCFICEVPGSDWICVQASGDPEMDYNTLKSYYAFGRIDLPDGSHVLLYGIYFLDCGELCHATYSATGDLLHRETIAGNDCDGLELNAEIFSPQSYAVYKTEYKYGHLGSLDHVTTFRMRKFQLADSQRWEMEEKVYEGNEARKMALAYKL